MSLSTWTDAYARAKAGTGRANILWVGDSYFEGQGAPNRSKRFVDLTIEGLRSAIGVTGGLGWSRPRWSGPQGNQTNWPASTGTGTGSNSENYQCAHAFQLGSGQYREWSLSGTSVDLAHPVLPGAGTMEVRIDGTLVDSFSQNGPASSFSLVRHYSLGSSGGHTVRVTSSGTTVVEGLQIFDGDYEAGVSFWECSRGGFTSGNFMPPVGATQGWANADTHLVIESMYGNDYLASGHIPSTVATRFTNRLNRYAQLPNSPHVITVLYWGAATMNGPNGKGYDHEDYRTAIRMAAQAGGAQVIDMSQTWPLVPSSYLAHDGVHPSEAGHAEFANLLLAEIPDPTQPALGGWRRRSGGAWTPVTPRKLALTGGA